MLDEFSCRVKLENAIRLQLSYKDADHYQYCEGLIEAYKTVLGYDEFTISIITRAIKEQELQRKQEDN